MTRAGYHATGMLFPGRAHGVGLARGVEGEDFLSALEGFALLTTCSDQFCEVWEEYESGYAEGVRVRNLLDNRSRGVAY